jgi:16S rRNA (cytosine1402-N4)-methyltransferase
MPLSRAFETAYHAPVLAAEVVDLFRNAKSVLDGTLGGGGHSEALLEAGVDSVIGVDRDPDAIATARRRLERFERAGRFRAAMSTFDRIADIPELHAAKFDGILLDLGVSSRQFDETSRGFTFREGAPLDMRMGQEGEGPTAADLLNSATEEDLTRIFRDYGDERRSARLAREIVRRRATESFATSDHLVRAIRGALGPRTGPSEFARLFQGLRIAVNDELDGLRRALPALRDRLNDGGVLAVITYHSGEDRIVKHELRRWSVDCICPEKQPVCTCGGDNALGGLIARKAITPSEAEIAANVRARSAKLRAWRRKDRKASGKAK